jgi:phage terminase large subunit
MFQRTTAINKLLALTKRKRVVQGGTSAGKTFGILPVLIQYAVDNPGAEISVVSESVPHLRRGAIKDFLKIMQGTGRYRPEGWNRTLLTYTFANGSYMEFFSADEEGRLRGARRNVLYVNEANNIPFENYYQLAIRTSGNIWLDFNPTQEFWAHTEVLKDDDSELLILTYKDNEALPDTIRDEIEKARDKATTSDYWANWWNVYGLGRVGSLQGTVFSNWDIVSDIPSDAKLIAYGLDFGFSVDPTAIVEVRKNAQGIWLNELLYEKELTNQDICKELEALGVQGQIIADSAEPKSIEEIRRQGWQVKGALKGRDSIRNSIDILLREPIHVTESSLNLITELRGYVWETDKTGKQTGRPIDDFNHCIDAVRYVALNKLKQGQGVYMLR